jgi:UDP-N-acetylmuramoylalanine--D-glutamate ligase
MTGNWDQKHAVIVGAARQGIALARFLVQEGAQVTLNDAKTESQMETSKIQLRDLEGQGYSFNWVTGSHPESLLESADILFVSGGVPSDLHLIQRALEMEIEVSNDSQLFLEYAPCKVIGITGSAGKTTTTAMIGEILKQAVVTPENQFHGQHIWVGGNIGNPLLSAVRRMDSGDIAVMELSSFQLEWMTGAPSHGVVLNILPDHLDRHASFDEYRKLKSRLILNQDAQNCAYLNRDDRNYEFLKTCVQGDMYSFGLSEIPEDQTGTSLQGGHIYFIDDCVVGGKEGESSHKLAKRKTPVLDIQSLQLPGRHNLSNASAACAVAMSLGIEPEIIEKAISGFRSIRHRLQHVRTWKSVAFFNDSIATTPDRSIAAIVSFEKPIILLAGGRDKNLSWQGFAETIRDKVSTLLLFGEAGPKIQKCVLGSYQPAFIVEIHQHMSDALQAAVQLAKPGDVVLLSPGCTSFDEFKNYETRGEAFIKFVMELAE